MKEFHRRDFANRTGLAQAWTVKSADRLFTPHCNVAAWPNANNHQHPLNLLRPSLAGSEAVTTKTKPMDLKA